jgi:hypothetical protein
MLTLNRFCLDSRARYRSALEAFFSTCKDALSSDSVNRFVTLALYLLYGMDTDNVCVS